uniref:Uncharacterized protein n=1 Tax=Bracon brevicornis TaxID=1563983 RepID=A0A6V7J6G2_9HYME
MVHINMRVFKVIALLVLGFSAINAVPASRLRAEHRDADTDLPLDNGEIKPNDAELVTNENSGELPKLKDDMYDQRQNGSENYNIHLDGLAIIVAPVEALLLAGIKDIPTPKPLDKPTEKPIEKPQNDKDQLLAMLKPQSGLEKGVEVKKMTQR